MENNEKVKNFLQLKLNECKEVIKKRKRKNMIINIMYTTSISISIIGSSIAVILSSIAIPTTAIACVSGVATLSSALSIKFNLQNRKNKLEKIIQHLNKIKDKIGYIISCNGDQR